MVRSCMQIPVLTLEILVLIVNISHTLLTELHLSPLKMFSPITQKLCWNIDGATIRLFFNSLIFDVSVWDDFFYQFIQFLFIYFSKNQCGSCLVCAVFFAGPQGDWKRKLWLCTCSIIYANRASNQAAVLFCSTLLFQFLSFSARAEGRTFTVSWDTFILLAILGSGKE